MTHQSFMSLCAYSKAKRNRFIPSKRVISRRSAKHPSVGQVLKNSRVREQVPMERMFNHPSWK